MSWPICLLKRLSDILFLSRAQLGVNVSGPLLKKKSAQGSVASPSRELGRQGMG